MATVEHELIPRAVSKGNSEKTRHLTGAGDAGQDLHADWLRYLTNEKNLAPNTLKLYSRTLEGAARDLGPLENLSPEEIRTWLDSKKGKPGTRCNRISAFTSFYKYLMRIDVRLDNPCDKLDRPKQEKGLPRPVADLPEALRACDEHDVTANEKGSIPRPVGQTRAMATFLAETGLRIHEAVALDVPTPCGDTLRLRGKGHKDAIIPLTDKAREALDFLGGTWPIGQRATQRRFEKCGFSPHQLRHWRGTSMAEAGCDLGDIQHALRHASPATTLVYAAWSTDRVRAALAKVT